MRFWMRRGTVILMAAILALSGCGEVVGTQEPANASQEDTQNTDGRRVILAGDPVDLKIRPQDDFYGYVNGETLWNLTVDFGQSTAGGFEEVYEYIDEQLTEIISEIVTSQETYEPGTDERVIRDYYEFCKTGKLTDKKIFDRVFAEIDAIRTIDDLLLVSGKLCADYGVASLYSLDVQTDPYDPTRRILAVSYLDTFLRNLKAVYEDDREVNAFRDTIEDFLMGLGVEYEEAGNRADKIAYLWLDIAAETDFEALEKIDIEKLSNRYPLSDLKEFLPTADVEGFLKNQGMKESEIRGVKEIVLYLPEQMEQVKTLITQENLETWKDYLKCAFCSRYLKYLPAEYTLDEIQEGPMDEDVILENIKKDCYGNLSPLYREKYYTPELSDYMERMEKDITDAYIKMIRDADWLTKEGRELFVEKFQNIHFYFGGEGRTEADEREKSLAGSTLLETMINKTRLQTRLRFEALTETPDSAQWQMGAQEVNAYYSPEANSIYITTGILHAPFFDLKADYAENLGGIGAVICHELSHAFDNTGILYDKNGKYDTSWVPQADQDAFAKVVEKVDAHYDNYALLDVYHVNGEKTVGENLADLGAVQCILSMAKTAGQREKMFENYARIWCTLYQKDDLIMYLTQDEHSPDIVRVNAVLSCFEEFHELYQVGPQDGMYLAPEGRVKRW